MRLFSAVGGCAVAFVAATACSGSSSTDEESTSGGGGSGGGALGGDGGTTGDAGATASGGNVAQAGSTGSSASCDDGQQNEAETDVDCGGSCAPCSDGEMCANDDDCEGFCRQGVCGLAPYAQTLSIASDASEDLVDHQVRVELSASNFDYSKAKSDGADLRVSTNGTSYDVDFFIESWNPSGTSVVWVSVPKIAAASTTKLLLMAGDKSLSSASNAENTFLFYDDFEDGTYSDKWENNVNTTATVAESGGKLSYDGNGNWEFLSTKQVFTGPVAAYATITQEYYESGSSSQSGLVVVDDDSLFRYAFPSSNLEVRSVMDVNVSTASASTGIDYPFIDPIYDTPHQVSVAARVTGTNLEILDFCHQSDCAGAQLFPNTAGMLKFDGGLRFGITSHGSIYTIEVDDFFVVKATDASLTVTVTDS